MSVSGETPRSISEPDRFDSRVGMLDSVDSVPSAETAELVYDHLDFVHGLNAYLDGFAGASTYAIRKGFHEAGAGDNSILIFSELMGFPTPAATANDDGSTTVTFGPERPSDSPASNWIQTTEGKGYFPILRLYSPLASFFDKSWRPSEIEPLG